jgi:catechol 2,3-dioxygenase-like lactoylglutathione lyase family enzyme
MDNVLIVVDDLEAAKAFFAELGMELEGEATNEGPFPPEGKPAAS